MSKMRYFFLSLNVLNGLLAVAVAAVVFFAVIPFLNPAAVPLPAAKGTAAGSGEKAAAIQSLRPAPADYAAIIEQNLFHPDRKVPPEKPQDKVLPKPDLVLYGTLITDNASYAFVEDRKAPYSTVGRGKRQITLRKGESLGGYTLREIGVDRIVLVKGEERLVVRLDDQEKRRGNGALPNQPAFSPVAPFPAQPSPSQGIGAVPASGQSPRPAVTPSSQAAQISGQGAASLGPAGDGSTPPGRRSRLPDVQRLKEARPMTQ